MDERNYLSHAEIHFTRYHPKEKAEFDENEDNKQMKIGPDFTNISESDRQLQKLVVSFAQTTLPVNFFRNAKSKSFTNELRSIKAVPSYDTIQRHMTKLAAEKLKVVQSAQFYGIQLDHWTNQQGKTVLVVAASWITSKWISTVQVIDFKVVSRQTATVTACEVLASLRACGLDEKNVWVTLDTLALNQMLKCHQKIIQVGRFFEKERPITDNVIYAVPQLQKACMTVSNRPDVHDTVRVFMSRLGSFMEKEKRFKNFSKVQIASALLNPDKDCRAVLSAEEMLVAAGLLKQFQEFNPLPCEAIIAVPTADNYSPNDPIEDAFTGLGSTNKVIPKEPEMAKSLDQDIQAFLETDEKDKSAAAFFSTPSNSRQFPILSEAARAVLGLLPSPANCERYFSRAQILSDKRRNKLSMRSIKERLILLSDV